MKKCINVFALGFNNEFEKGVNIFDNSVSLGQNLFFNPESLFVGKQIELCMQYVVHTWAGIWVNFEAFRIDVEGAVQRKPDTFRTVLGLIRVSGRPDS